MEDIKTTADAEECSDNYRQGWWDIIQEHCKHFYDKEQATCGYSSFKDRFAANKEKKEEL